jgi:hypothetical protein
MYDPAEQVWHVATKNERLRASFARVNVRCWLKKNFFLQRDVIFHADNDLPPLADLNIFLDPCKYDENNEYCLFYVTRLHLSNVGALLEEQDFGLYTS